MSKIRTGNVAGRAAVKLRAPLRKAPEGPSRDRAVYQRPVNVLKAGALMGHGLRAV
jgi:hypothetical protein